MILHTAGQHTKDKNLIQLATWEVESDHDLVAGPQKTFDMGTDVEITGISVRPEDSTYHAYVSYVETDDDAQILRVLFVDMEDTATASTYKVHKSNNISLNGGSVTRTFQDV